MNKVPRESNKVAPLARRFLREVFRPVSSLGKRNRDDDGSHGQRTPSICPPPAACVALTNEDHAEDAVVITALNMIPFCCHADLLTMTRDELFVVAETLNAKLPSALQIDVGPSCTDALIRQSIEFLVGLRRNVPHAPKPVKSNSVFVEGHVLQSPESPLANKSKSDMSLCSPRLAALQEEDENPFAVESRPPLKRRRFEFESPLGSDAIFSPRAVSSRPIARSQSHRVRPTHAGSPTRGRTAVLRTRSQKLPERKPILQGIHPNVTLARGRTGSRGSVHARAKNAVMTSTPKKRRILEETAVNTDGEPSEYGYANGATLEKGSWKIGVKRKLSQTSVDTAEVTFGIDGMTMTTTKSSEMDVGAD